MNLHIPRDWKPANAPRDPRGRYDVTENLRRMRERVGFSDGTARMPRVGASGESPREQGT